MTTTKHTPGPWEVQASDRGNHYTVRYRAPHCTGQGELIATRIEFVKDARLIAAAPDLLYALQGLIDFLDQYPHPDNLDISGYMRCADAAITKATKGK